jgi:TolB protein
MLRDSLLAAVLLPLVGLGSGAGHVRNGRIAYSHLGAGSNRARIYTTTAQGTRRRHLIAGTFSNLAPAYSPNGKRIVFVRASKQSDLWTMNADGSRKRNLTSTAHVDEIAPAWSPGGKELAFAVESPAALQGIWVVGVDGQGSRQVTDGDDNHPSWSPDGSTIAFQRYDAATQVDSVLVVPAAGGTTTTLSGNPAVSDLDPAWSPDGSHILFVSDRPDTFQLDLWVMSADGGNVQRVTNTPNRDEGGAAWSPDGRRIVYSGNGSFHGASSSQLYVADADGTNRLTLTHACGDCAWVNEEPTWQPLP